MANDALACSFRGSTYSTKEGSVFSRFLEDLCCSRKMGAFNKDTQKLEIHSRSGSFSQQLKEEFDNLIGK